VVRVFDFVFLFGLNLVGERVGELDVTDETDEDVVDVEHGEVDKSNDLSLDWFFILLLLLLLSRNDFGDNG
jgi:hypothetical protein